MTPMGEVVEITDVTLFVLNLKHYLFFRQQHRWISLGIDGMSQNSNSMIQL